MNQTLNGFNEELLNADELINQGADDVAKLIMDQKEIMDIGFNEAGQAVNIEEMLKLPKGMGMVDELGNLTDLGFDYVKWRDIEDSFD